MIERLDLLEKRFDEINNLLMQNDVVSDVTKSRELSIELKGIEETVITYRKYKKVLSDIEETKEMTHDAEIADFAREELTRLNEEKIKLEDELKILLLPKDENDGKNVIMEIRGAAGGDEANIFAGDLFRMYQKYCENNGWKLEIVDYTEGTAGGFAQIEFIIKGDNVYSKLKYENGSHRVQRVPVTEANGRLQTSIATVLVMPEAEEVDFDLDEKDLRIDTFCSSGPGGQGVNTTYSAVRVTYIPTGEYVACQICRSQHENKQMAMEILRTRIYQRIKAEEDEKNGATRQSLIGHGERSEKIRTYNYPQNRVTDHRIGFSINRLDAIIDGKLDLVIPELINEDQKKKLEAESQQ
jgi:peptide chain release factor 1